MPHAVSLAKAFGSEITLAHVMQPPSEHNGVQTNDPIAWEISRQEARGYLERVEKEVSQALGRPVEVRLEQGRPAERIAELARELNADLTVLGSHGEAGVTRLNLGSTVQQVLAVARGSVFVAHSTAFLATQAVSPKRILVALDGSLRAEIVLPTAARMAAIYGAELLLVHVVQEPLSSSVLYAAEDLELARTLAEHLEASSEQYLARLKQALLHEGTNVRTLVVRHANAHQCLLELSNKEEADLIVLSAHGVGCDSARSFGSVTAFLLTYSMAPVLVLQDLQADDLHAASGVSGKLTPRSLRASYAPETV